MQTWLNSSGFDTIPSSIPKKQNKTKKTLVCLILQHIKCQNVQLHIVTFCSLRSCMLFWLFWPTVLLHSRRWLAQTEREQTGDSSLMADATMTNDSTISVHLNFFATCVFSNSSNFNTMEGNQVKVWGAVLWLLKNVLCILNVFFMRGAVTVLLRFGLVWFGFMLCSHRSLYDLDFPQLMLWNAYTDVSLFCWTITFDMNSASWWLI